MRIAITMPLAQQRGGGELMLRHLLQKGRGAGVEWSVLFLEDGPMVAEARAFGIDTRVFPAGRLRQPYRLAKTVAFIARTLRLVRADAAFAWMPKAHLYTAPAAAIAGIPALWYHLGIADPGSWMDLLVSALPSAGIVVLSRAGLNAQRRLTPRRHIRLVYPGVELDRFDPAVLPSPADARRKLRLPPSVPLIGIIGRLQHWKGMHVLVKAMPRILSAHPDAHCVIVGGEHPQEPQYARYLREEISSLHLGDRVRLAGFQQDVPLWMQALDLVVHASDREPFGIVVIEAMALGKPVVAGAAGGPAEIITDGTDGTLAPFGDHDALADGIVDYLDDPAKAARIGAAARRRAAEFSTDRFAGNLIRAIRDLLITRNGSAEPAIHAPGRVLKPIGL